MIGRWSFLVALAALALFAGAHVDLSTDITHFMPDSGRAGLASVSRELARSPLSRTMILTVGVRQPDAEAPTDPRRSAAAVAAASSELAAWLAKQPEVAWVHDGGDEEFGKEVWELYFPRRFYFASLDPEGELAERTTDAALARSAAEARAALLSPIGMLTKRTLERDPLGLFAGLMEAMTAQAPAGREADLQQRDGRLWSRDGHAVLFVATRSSAFASGPQGEFLDALAREFESIAGRHGGGDTLLVLERSGANRFAVDAERSIRRDVYRIAVLSVVGVVAIFFAFFPSPWRLFLVLLPAVSGIVAATAACIVVFGRIDGLTLAFGSALIGVAIDYPIHLLNHESLQTGDLRRSSRRLAATLSLGAATTIAGFAGLALTAFPGFREIGVFAMSGIAAALLVTLLVVPSFSFATFAAPARARAAAQALDRLLARARSARRPLMSVPLLVAVVAVVCLPKLRWEDDLAKLNRIDPRLQAEDERVRARVTSFESGRFVVAVGDDIESALSANERVQLALRPLTAAGALGDQRSVSDFLRSRELQLRSARVLTSLPQLAARVERAFVAAGFNEGTTEPFMRDLEAFAEPGTVVAPLTRRDLDGTGLTEIVDGLLVDIDADFGRVAAVTQLRGLDDAAALQRAIAGMPGVYFLDQRDLANRVYAEFRWRTLRQITVGCGLVLAVLLLRYRHWRPALAAFAPSAAVALAIPSLAAAVGMPLNLLHAVSLVMVMGMGVDYGIFLVDGAREKERAGATTLSLLLSCSTTVMVFGVLALSSNPALTAIGWTTGLGVLLSFVFAPIALVLVEERL